MSGVSKFSIDVERFFEIHHEEKCSSRCDQRRSVSIAHRSFQNQSVTNDLSVSSTRKFHSAFFFFWLKVNAISFFSVHDGVFRQYSSDRSFSSLKNFIENEEWKSVEPISGFFAPDGILFVNKTTTNEKFCFIFLLGFL